MKKVTIPDYIKSIMQDIINVHPTAVIAGGYIRDLFTGAPYTDIDVFIHETGTCLSERKIAKLFSLVSANGDKIQTLLNLDPKGSCAGKQHIHRVFDIIKDGENFQAIILNKTPQEYINNHFDTGINMCYFDGNMVRFTQEFMDDIQNKTITIRGMQDPFELYLTVTRHVPKLLKKYPNFTVVVDTESVQGFKQVF